MRLCDINPQNTEKLFDQASKIFVGADSRVIEVGGYCLHEYKEHVDAKLFGLYLLAISQSSQVLAGEYRIPSLDQTIDICVLSVLKHFVANNNKIVSVTEWINWQRGDVVAKQHENSYLVHGVIDLVNSKLRYPNTQVMGIEVVPQNTRFNIANDRIQCKITDVGNSLRYLHSASRW